MSFKPATPEAYQLLHEGTIAFSQLEHNGIRLDEKHLQKQRDLADSKARELEAELKADPIFKIWRKCFGAKTNLGSRDQLAQVIFMELKHPCREWTAGRVDKRTGKVVKRPKADESAFELIDEPFVKKYLRMAGYQKDSNTFLAGLQRYCCNGFIHTSLSLNKVVTYRSSSEDPNLQNLPIRDPISGQLIRSCVIPRSKDYVLLEADLSGAEVRVGYCYHKDPQMRTYLLDETTDMHRDMAIQCYKLKHANLPDGYFKQKGPGGGVDPRYCAKNMYVFPQFYGDYYVNCARAMWEAIEIRKMAVGDTPLREILAKQGITELGECDPDKKPVPGTFEYHIKEVQDHFWKKRFKVYDAWKTKWYEAYRKCGGFNMYTGFKCEGLMSKNDVTNYPVQGAAFHCELWSLIQLQKWLNKYKMKSKIILQIHDSILLDCHKSELKVVAEKINEIMTVDLLNHWKWLIIPMKIEIEVSDTNWHEKHEYKLAV